MKRRLINMVAGLILLSSLPVATAVVNALTIHPETAHRIYISEESTPTATLVLSGTEGPGPCLSGGCAQ